MRLGNAEGCMELSKKASLDPQRSYAAPGFSAQEPEIRAEMLDLSAEMFFPSAQKSDPSTEKFFPSAQKSDPSTEKFFPSAQKSNLSAEKFFHSAQRSDH